MTFSGWTPDALAFFRELAVNNTKPWWTANKHRYDTDVYAPMAEFAADVASIFGTLKIRRPHRDVRFSADKSPYKTTIAGGIETGGGMLLGLQLSTEGLGVVAGHFALAPDQLERFRVAIDNDVTGRAFEKVVHRLATNGYPLRSFSQLKSVPRGYPKDHPRAALLTYKGLHVDSQFGPDALPTTSKQITKAWIDARPLLDFLHEHVGPTTLAQIVSRSV
jgi:uncharacterized protein (TIGR02453 family)